MADAGAARVRALPPLEDRISFLMHRIEAKLELICNPYFRRYDVALHNSRMLVMLAESGSTRVGDLVSRMVLPQSTISHQLMELEKRRLIRRSPGIKDSRSVMVQLTARGKRVAQRCNDLSAEVYRAMVDGLSAAELEQLRSQLRGMYERLAVLSTAQETAAPARRPKKAAVRRARTL
jgi:MarR family transcriptional regulator, organic hydroperoxide resistance regulator